MNTLHPLHVLGSPDHNIMSTSLLLLSDHVWEQKQVGGSAKQAVILFRRFFVPKVVPPICRADLTNSTLLRPVIGRQLDLGNCNVPPRKSGVKAVPGDSLLIACAR